MVHGVRVKVYVMVTRGSKCLAHMTHYSVKIIRKFQFEFQKEPFCLQSSVMQDLPRELAACLISNE